MPRLPVLVFEGAAERDAHPLLDLLRGRIRGRTARSLFEALYAHLLLAGNAYVEAVALGDAAAVRELYALRPDRIKRGAGRRRLGRGLRLHRRRAQRALRPAAPPVPPILHLTLLPSARRSLRPGAARGRGVAVDTHNAAARWNKALLDNAARPSGALVYAGPMARAVRRSSSTG
jgi:phage portal protein BeeE